MSERDEWTGCVHCGQTLPHEGTGWREASRCRLFQRIAEQAWGEGYEAGGDDERDAYWGQTREPYTNPYRAQEPA